MQRSSPKIIYRDSYISAFAYCAIGFSKATQLFMCVAIMT